MVLRIAAGGYVIYTSFFPHKHFMLTVPLFFKFQADDGAFSIVCNVNITIRDVNNHAPKFVRDNYMATIAENTAIGECNASIYQPGKCSFFPLVFCETSSQFRSKSQSHV